MASPTNVERISYGGSTGSLQLGSHREVIHGVGATRTLLAKESGALCLLDLAAGVTYTLPAPVEGMNFEFSASVVGTGTYKILTNASTVFLLGAYMVGDAAIATSGDVFTGNGSTHRAITMDLDTKGRLVGGNLKFTALSATQWFVSGMVIGTGAIVDAFATS